MLKYFLVILVICIFSQAFGGPNEKKDLFQIQLDHFFKQAEMNGGLKEGMSFVDVRKIVGTPDNKDQDRVWLWVEKNRDDLLNLKTFLKHKKRYGRGFFLIFDQGKLITPVPLLTSKDWDILLKIDEIENVK